MDPDKVTRLIHDLKLSIQSKKEVPIIIDNKALKTGEQRVESCLIAKVLTPKPVNLKVVKQQIMRILQTIRKIEIGSLGDNIFMLDFKSPHDRKRALGGGDLIIFRQPLGMHPVSEICFNETSLWVQCYNLPLAHMHRDTLHDSGQQCGIG